jgi:uncharacterized protein
MSMVGQSLALIDASAYYALIDTHDQNHIAAREIATGLAAAGARLYTTNYILAETHALLLVRFGRTIAARALQEIDRSSATVVRVTAGDERRAREIIFRYTDKDFSLTDACSFSVMEHLGIPQAFAFDRHFAQFGISVLTPGNPF